MKRPEESWRDRVRRCIDAETDEECRRSMRELIAEACGLYRRVLPDGREVMVQPLLFGRSRLGVSAAGATVEFEDEW